MTKTERSQCYLRAIAAVAPRQGERADPAEGIFQLLPLEAFYALAVLETGSRVGVPALLQAALERVQQRRDCADFVLVALLRLLYRPKTCALLLPEERAALDEATRGFCYWWDQRDAAGRGIQGMCFHTENHQILFHAAEILAGQRLPETVFSGTQRTGAWHVEQGTLRAWQWLHARQRFGFAEWLSCYFDEDLLALVSLADFAHDARLRAAARAMVDSLLHTVALHSFQGTVGTTQGRTYAEFLKGRRHDPLSLLTWLVFGLGEPELTHPTFAATALATSDYTCPPELFTLAHATPAPEGVVIRQRQGVGPEEAEAAGIDLSSLQDASLFWAVQNARHPRLRATALRLAQAAEDRWLENFIGQTEGIDDGNEINTSLGPVDTYTFRTADYQLSCAQDFRPGGPGYQQHVWQATLGRDAVVFTTQPGGLSESSAHAERPNFWAGNRWLPRAAQYRSVVLCLHQAPPTEPLAFSHAYFPRAAFDEVETRGGWTFARYKTAYLALFCSEPTHWCSPEELRTTAAQSAWICELGAAATEGTFSQFIEQRAAAPLEWDGVRSLAYSSPTLGLLTFGWAAPLRVAGQEIPLHHYPRPEYS